MLKSVHHQWKLREEHKNFVEGGTPGGAHWTPYKSTISDVKDYLRRQLLLGKNDGWISIDAILEHCETHYSNPKSSLAKSLIDFENDWCESKKIGRKMHFRFRYKESVVS